MKISSKFALNLSAFTSTIFLFFSLYKGIVLFYVKKAMEDTFVGGNTSDVSIILWFVIAGILSLITFMFLFFLKIKDLKSQKIILYSVTIFWIIVSVSLVLITKLTFYPYLITILTSLFCFLAIKNLKKEIITELNKKGLTEKEIYLLQRLAGIKKK